MVVGLIPNLENNRESRERSVVVDGVFVGDESVDSGTNDNGQELKICYPWYVYMKHRPKKKSVIQTLSVGKTTSIVIK